MTPELPLPTLSIAAHSPRAQNFLNIFERLDNIPIKSWTPLKAELSAISQSALRALPQSALVYELDLERITPDEHRRLTQFVAVRFNETAHEVAKVIATNGFPIINGPDLIVAIPMRLFT